jgi:hypothetical protein
MRRVFAASVCSISSMSARSCCVRGHGLQHGEHHAQHGARDGACDQHMFAVDVHGRLPLSVFVPVSRFPVLPLMGKGPL